MNQPIPIRRVRQKDWALTGDAFRHLLAWFDDDSQRAADVYQHIHAKLVRFFQWRGCLTPEEYADRAFDRVARRLEEGLEPPTGDPQTYLYGVALNIWREHQRQPGQTSLDSASASPELAVDPEEQVEQEAERTQKERQIACLERCVQKLPLETQRLLIHYHCAESKKSMRKELAKALGIGLELLRTRVYRLRLTLENCVTACLARQMK